MSDVRKKKRRWLRRSAAIASGLVLGWTAWGWVESASHADAAQIEPAPIDQSTGKLESSQSLTAEAQALLKATLDRASKAYSVPMRVAGKLTGKFDVADQRDERSMNVYGAWKREPDDAIQLRHIAEGEMQFVSDGQRAWMMQPGSGRYLSMPANQIKQHMEVMAMLAQQNPAVMVAAMGDARAALIPAGVIVTSCEAEAGLVRIKSVEEGVVVDSLFDEATGLIVEMRTDFAGHLASRGVTGIREAWASVRYESHDRVEQFPEEEFRFTPPPGAIEESIELPIAPDTTKTDAKQPTRPTEPR
jgi:hypothetical protein